jgi:probable phosphoglycerate mutase
LCYNDFSLFANEAIIISIRGAERNMKILIIRHAEPDYPNHTITAAGHAEAQALAAKLARERIDRIYCSPVNRALHTMRYTAERLGLEPVIEPWTRELSWHAFDAQGEKMAAWNIPGEQARASLPTAGRGTWEEQTPYRDFAAQYEQLQADSDAFLRRHGYERVGGRYRILRPNRETIAVFCHLGFGLTWLSHLLELPFPLMWCGFWLPPSSVTTVLFEERSPEWAVPRCLGLGDVSHLHMAGLSVSTAGLLGNVT